MSFPFKNLLFSSTFNFCLFLMLIIGIQNSSEKEKINLIINETVELPLSFIVGTSFIAGSVIGFSIPLNLGKR